MTKEDTIFDLVFIVLRSEKAQPTLVFIQDFRTSGNATCEVLGLYTIKGNIYPKMEGRNGASAALVVHDVICFVPVNPCANML